MVAASNRLQISLLQWLFELELRLWYTYGTHVLVCRKLHFLFGSGKILNIIHPRIIWSQNLILAFVIEFEYYTFSIKDFILSYIIALMLNSYLYWTTWLNWKVSTRILILENWSLWWWNLKREFNYIERLKDILRDFLVVIAFRCISINILFSFCN